MSEDQQTQPESVNSEPQTPPTPSSADQSGTGLENIIETAEPTQNRELPFLKAQSVKVLRTTIDILEGIVGRLEAEPVRELPATAAPPASMPLSAPSLDTPTTTPKLESVSDDVEPVISLPTSDTPAGVQQPSVTPDLESVSDDQVEPVISRPASDTPAGVQQPSVTSEFESVSDDQVEAVISRPASNIPTVAPKASVQEPVIERSPQPTKPNLIDRLLPSFRSVQAFWDNTLVKIRALLPDAWNNKLSDWALTGAIAGIVTILLVTTAALLPETPDQLAKAPPNSIEAPPKLVAPEPPEPVEVEPPPAPELTPEQSLIAAIQTQVAEITDQYGNGLIQSIEANFLGSRLIVKVSDGWYDLQEPQQNKLADEILSRSQELDFSKLEITDLEGTLLARSPVVGSNMVILKRQELAVNL
jgi:hypothetical protein